MTESQPNSESNQDAAADRAESLSGDAYAAGNPVPIEVWQRTLDEVRRLSEELADARERAARAEAEASFLREVLAGRTQKRAASAPSRSSEDEPGIFDVQDEPDTSMDDPEGEAQRQQALRKAIAEQLRTYTEQRSRDRRRPWKRD